MELIYSWIVNTINGLNESEIFHPYLLNFEVTQPFYDFQTIEKAASLLADGEGMKIPTILS